MAFSARVTMKDAVFVVTGFSSIGAVRSFAETASKQGVWMESWNQYVPNHLLPTYYPAHRIIHVEVFQDP